MSGITILGSTGSIGVNTLDVIRQHPGRYEVVALTAHTSVDKLYEQCLEWHPRYAVLRDESAAEQLQNRLASSLPDIEVLAGEAGLEKVAALPEVSIVMAAIVGAAGLLSTLAAAQAGKKVLLANKEALVMSGQLFMDAISRNQATLLPIDSEHNAIFQCLFNQDKNAVERILLTASGGPFRTWSPEQLADVTPAQACAHPNWEMGQKISVDSATMMNKGLEVIEAHWLFNLPTEQIEVLIHPQSVIHSLVEYADGSLLAQLGNPDMRTPIAYGLAWPQRMASGVARLDLTRVAKLNFEAADFSRFPCLQLAYEALIAGGTTTTILNAANEVAVDAFLNQKLAFTQIAAIIEQTLGHISGRPAQTLEVILEDDQQAREFATAKLT
ncbi:1-deoxy-D-xylulose-5-phosphate reductoisomerase [Candidatus Venteria ishoeyi]|uniref:1-deoxy-D-xylulose-5-phosphate reductoisomerase n=1 Tax=Candidatus Venteria ishoeyi TaxID=1899563 RepID=UPI0025A52C16|nr:1-deoxy-D-xylulose-5-phosphate reductoisomerase [Candidatus Venteria ishoeyi]MDM8547985.1 1-deoxy-D-xylulose-5-phosphate reductoisomerase [Candidatus Venteria ishoeyi]